MASCSYSSLLKEACSSECGPSWKNPEDVSSHLKTCKVVDDRIENEFQLLLARAGTVHDSIYYYYYYFSIGTRFRFVFY